MGGPLSRLTRLRSECRRRLRDVTVPDPFDLTAFCAGIARRRGRPLYLHPLPTPAATPACGLWLATGTADHIFHANGVTPLHRQHIVLHEIGHMLCEHTDGNADAVGITNVLLPDLDPAMVARVLRRNGYHAREEKMAEMMASLIGGPYDGADNAGRVDPAFTDLADLVGIPHGGEHRG